MVELDETDQENQRDLAHLRHSADPSDDQLQQLHDTIALNARTREAQRSRLHELEQEASAAIAEISAYSLAVCAKPTPFVFVLDIVASSLTLP